MPFESSGSFSNYHLAAIVLAVPFFLTRLFPTFYFSFKTWYTFFLILTGLPVTVLYWNVMSKIGGNVRDYGIRPGKDIEHYMDITDPELKAIYHGQKKIPIQLFYDSYFEGKIELKGEHFGAPSTHAPRSLLTRLTPDRRHARAARVQARLGHL